MIALAMVAACSGGNTKTTVGTESSVVVSSSVSGPIVTVGPGPTSSSSAPAGPCGHGGAPVGRYDHVVWIWMENHSVDDVLGPSAPAPFEHDLAANCGSGTAYHAVGSPSLPNYIAATSGTSSGIDDDAAPTAHQLDSDNLFRQVRDQGGTARSYEEAMAHNCQLQNGASYAVKHNPQAYFVGASDHLACERDDVPLGELTGGSFVDDLASGRLPTFSFITPDLCHDTHDCGVDKGDRWLQDWVTLILDSPTYSDGKTAVLVVWDEPTPMPVLVISPTTPSGTTSAVAFDHYSLLRTTEELLGLSSYLGEAATASSMRSDFGL
jgi:hypothetical protein